MIVLSLGAGVQSTVMALMAELGELERPDCAIFADTGWEPRDVYRHLEWLESRLSFPVHRVSAGNIRDDAVAGINTTGQRFASMPFFTSGNGMGRRQCTSEYKIKPIRKKIREMLGRERGPVQVGAVQQWIGISTDEMQRMKDSGVKFIQNRFPLIENRMSRTDCQSWFVRRFPGVPLVKSACVACPYKSNSEWMMLAADEFEDACRFDDAVRNHPLLDEQQFVHADRIPLREVDLRRPSEFGQLSWLDECDGMCGV